MSDYKKEISDNIEKVRWNIIQSAEKCGRNPGEITLIAVSKTKPVSYMEAAYGTGIRDFGENKVQELLNKYELMPKDVRWHMIGHLQTNKVKYLIGKTVLIHSVDSIRLAEEIQKEALKKNIKTDILIEVNVSEEDSKYGIRMEDTEKVIHQISEFSHVFIRGLMTVAPYVENPSENRAYFEKLKQLSVDIKEKNIDNVCMDFISMGMTGDYVTAISSGATHIRVGTGIFGTRSYSIKDKS